MKRYRGQWRTRRATAQAGTAGVLLLLSVGFLVALLVCCFVTRLFARYINQILNLMVGETLAGEWTTYLKFTAALIAYVIFRVFEGRKNAT